MLDVLPGARCLSISKSRRISLPRNAFRFDSPYVLVEVVSPITPEERMWLALMDPIAMPRLAEQVPTGIRIVSTYTTHRPTISKEACQKAQIVPGGCVWVVGNGDLYEVWSESVRRALQEDAFIAGVSDSHTW